MSTEAMRGDPTLRDKIVDALVAEMEVERRD